MPHSSTCNSCRSLTARRWVWYGSISGYSSRTAEVPLGLREHSRAGRRTESGCGGRVFAGYGEWMPWRRCAAGAAIVSRRGGRGGDFLPAHG
ncbi:hypothetical protein [Lysobacter gummosus]|uniref:hypothetical protein n=1 Tax=Lysobacter gummosus TaxID=262324 RepID=UPI0036442A90